VTEQWYLERVVVVSDPHGAEPARRCFPCHDVVQARVTLRTGNGQSHGFTHANFSLCVCVCVCVCVLVTHVTLCHKNHPRRFSCMT